MQKDNDQRTDKELEVQEYLSQFDADEEISEDDTDISSFLMDDPEDSAEPESDGDYDDTVDSDGDSDENSSESNELTKFDFTEVPNGDTDLLSIGDEDSDEHSESEIAINENEEAHDIDTVDEEITVEEPLEYTEASEEDLNLQDIQSVDNTDADLDSDDAAAGAAYVNSLLASEGDEGDIEDQNEEQPAEESMDESADEQSTEEISDTDQSAEAGAAEEDGWDESPSDSKKSDEDSSETTEEKLKEKPSERKLGLFHRRKKKIPEKPLDTTSEVVEAQGVAEPDVSKDEKDDENSDIEPTLEPHIAESDSDEDISDALPIETTEETPEEIRDREIVAVSDALLEDDVKESEKHQKHEKKLSRAEKKAARKKEGRKLKRFLSLFVENPNYDASQGEEIVKDGKHLKNKPKKFSFFHLFRDCVLAGCLCVLIFICYSFVIITQAPKIDPVNIYDNIQQSSVIYNDKGKAVDSAYYTQDRKICKYEDMPENLVNAFVALEDKTFWKHHGFNWTRMIGAVFQSLTGSGKISGTSTITQQLARNVYLTDTMSQRSIKRKVLEMYYAAVIERKLSKEKIVEAYLNTIYLGFGNYGVEAASESYFGKEPKDLSLVQCASLAALPQAPDSYALVQMLSAGENPDNNDTVIKKRPNKYVANDESKDRRETCLYLMKDQGYITDKEYKEASGKKLTDFLHPQLSNKSSVYAYFHEYLLDQVVQDLMDKYDYSEDKATDLVYTGGLNIYSTIDSQAQKTIVKEFKKDSNFPSIAGYSTDGNGNIINSGGGIMLYAYDNFFNGKNEFKLKSSECKINDDGSLTIKSGYRLNIYNTASGYSLEFKPTYVNEGGKLYMYNGGYINIPSKYETMDDNDNLVISAKFFKKYPGWIKLGKHTATITEEAYTLPEKTIEPQAAMVIVEVGTGQVKAMVGGRKQTGRQLYNRALNPRQSGSSIKPISVYSGALQKSYDLAKEGKKFPYKNTGHDSQGTKYYGDYLTASSVIVDERMTFNGQTWPQNASNSFSGAVTMRKALQNSINVCAVKLELQVGSEYIADLVEKFGITTLDREGGTNDMNPAALALGGLTNGVIPLEMAQAYAAFPNGGVRQSSIAYTKVTDRNGKVLLTKESESSKVLDKGVAFIMTDMLKSVVSQGIGSPASISGVQAGGKTGTTSSEYDIWFDGFTPSYAAALWIGNDVNMQLTSMSGPAAALWGKIMNQIPNAKKGHYKSQPDDVVQVGSEYYTSGTEGGRSTYFADRAREAAQRKAAAAAKKKSSSKKSSKSDDDDD